MSLTRRLAPIVAAVAVLALAATPAGARSEADFKPCAAKPGDVGFDLRVRDVACSNARNVAYHFIVVAHASDDGYRGWSCSNTQRADDPIQNACKRRKGDVKQKLKFQFAG